MFLSRNVNFYHVVYHPYSFFSSYILADKIPCRSYEVSSSNVGGSLHIYDGERTCLQDISQLIQCPERDQVTARTIRLGVWHIIRIAIAPPSFFFFFFPYLIKS